MAGSGVTRRGMLRSGAGVIAAGSALSAPMVHAQGTGGKVSVAFWDHWVPAGNDAMRGIVNEWAQKNRVEVQMDFVTSAGNKLLLTIAAEAQARQGHDVIAMDTWRIFEYQRQLEPVDDLMTRLIAQHGAVNAPSEYLGKPGGKWHAIPATMGGQYKGGAARIDLMKQHAGIDVQAMYPAENRLGPGAENWNWETFLTAADKLNKAGYPFALPCGTFSDAVDWVGACFAAHGAYIMDKDGNTTLRNNDKVKQVMDYFARLFQHIPSEMFAADDATNNRALISGKSALIFNPPSAWAVAKRDAPQVAEQVWHFPSPKGPSAHYVPYLNFFWSIWSFSRNKPTAKALLEHLSQREQIAKMVAASDGYDIPPFASMTDLPTWAEVAPPKGTVFNYPVKPHHQAQPYIALSPAPPEIAVQMYTQAIQPKMIARMVQSKEPVDRVLAWAEREIEGFKRG